MPAAAGRDLRAVVPGDGKHFVVPVARSHPWRGLFRSPLSRQSAHIFHVASALHSSFERKNLGSMRPKKTILCVDDNEQSLSVRKFMLETRGYRVLTAVSSKQALELFREGGIDLVLSDLVMPYMDGNELVRRMKELAPEVPAILISGSVKAFDRADHANAFLPKGACSPVEMLECIRVMVARKHGPKKGYGLRPLVAECPAETIDSVVVGV
jgi:two-component system, OmpR family, response regulator CpxR